MRRFFLDTEFTDLPWTGRSELLWIGLADESGGSWSTVDADTDLGQVSDFVREHVLRLIPDNEPRLPRLALARAVLEFVGVVDEFWAWCPSEGDLIGLGLSREEATAAWERYWDWDFQLLRRLVTPWPASWPTVCRDLHRLAHDANVHLPPNPRPHHPAADARWNAEVFALAGTCRS